MIATWSLVGILALFLGWAGWDAAVRTGKIKGEHTASSDIQAWVRRRKWHLGVGAIGVVAAATYLILHLFLQVI